MKPEEKNLNFELEEVPKHLRRTWFGMFSILVAVGCDLASVMLGGQLANGMSLSNAILVACVGAIITASLCTICAVVGSSTNLSTSMITKYVFGKYGALPFSLITGISLLGWYGVQVGFFADNVQTLLQGYFGLAIDIKLLCFIGGMLMMTTSIYGFRAMEKLSVWSVPFLLVLLLITLFLGLKNYSLPVEIKNLESFTFGSAVSIVISGYILGAILQPDISRWAKSKKDAIISTFFGILLGQIFMITLAILLSKAMRTDDMMRIFLTLGLAIPGIIILTLTQWVTNTGNLYSSSLSFSLVFEKIPKKLLTIILGFIATGTAVFGIFENFIPFLEILAVFIAPVGGIYVAEFFLVKTEFKRYQNRVEAQKIVVHSIISWVVGIIVTYLTTSQPTGLQLFSLTTIPSLDGFLTGFAVQAVIGKLLNHRVSIQQINVHDEKI
ncbi:cytosine permease [Peribacillus frigoritolerans]|uniref:cytosine permease n=1 Tax=Peribacillus frigoritolerans TaxID=450367 RepID=UPI0032E48CF2